MSRLLIRFTPLVLLAAVAACSDGSPTEPPSAPDALAASGPGAGAFWPFGGQNLQNTRHADRGVHISSANVGSLGVKWVFQAGGDISATPSVDATSVYFPDWAGNVFSLDRKTGEVNWARQDFAGAPGNFSRTTPAIHGNMVIYGDQGGRQFQGATLWAVNKRTGEPIWTTQLDAHPAAIVTQSPIVFSGHVYVGVSSSEELFATAPGYPCCTFRGSVVALDVNTGAIVWKTYMAPDIAGYSGNAVWGPTAALDVSRGSLYVTTGNNYTVPQAELDCVAANQGDPDAIAACLDPANYFDSVVSLDLTTGQVLWASKTVPFDAWTVACIFGFPEENCTSPTGPNLDFGEGPALFTTGGSLFRKDVVGAGQKSGQYWVFDRGTGEVVWWTQAGPGSLLGGMIWGSAVDGERIYTANANALHTPHGLVGGGVVDYGFWSAMDAVTGEIVWQTPDPIAGNVNQGPVTVANDVVFACSMDADGHMYAMDARTGSVLWSFASGGSCNAGAAVVGSSVYWGSGYSSLAGFLQPNPTGNNKLYAFELPD